MAVDNSGVSRGQTPEELRAAYESIYGLDPYDPLEAFGAATLSYDWRRVGRDRPLGIHGATRYSDSYGSHRRTTVELPATEGDDAAAVKLNRQDVPAADEVAVFINLPSDLVAARERTAQRVQAIAAAEPGLTIAAGRPHRRVSDGLFDDRLEVHTSDNRVLSITVSQDADVRPEPLAVLAAAALDFAKKLPEINAAPIVVGDVASVGWDQLSQSILFPVALLDNEHNSEIGSALAVGTWFGFEDRLYATSPRSWQSLTTEVLKEARRAIDHDLPLHLDPPWAPESHDYRSRYSTRRGVVQPIEPPPQFDTSATQAVADHFGDAASLNPRALVSVIFANHLLGSTKTSAERYLAEAVPSLRESLARRDKERLHGRADRVDRADRYSSDLVRRSQSTSGLTTTSTGERKVPPWKRQQESTPTTSSIAPEQPAAADGKSTISPRLRRRLELSQLPSLETATQKFLEPLPYSLNHGFDRFEENRAAGRLPHRPDHARFGTRTPIELRPVTGVFRNEGDDSKSASRTCVVALTDDAPAFSLVEPKRRNTPAAVEFGRVRVTVSDHDDPTLISVRSASVEVWTPGLPRNDEVGNRLAEVLVDRAASARADLVALRTREPHLRAAFAARGAAIESPSSFVADLFRSADKDRTPSFPGALRSALSQAGLDASSERYVRTKAFEQLNKALVDAKLVPTKWFVSAYSHGAVTLRVPATTKPVRLGRDGSLRWTKLGGEMTPERAIVGLTPQGIVEAMRVEVNGRTVEVGRALLDAINWTPVLQIDSQRPSALRLPDSDPVEKQAAIRALREVETIWPEAADINRRLGADYDPVFAATWWHTPSGQDQVIPLERIDVSVGRRRVDKLVGELEAR